MEGINLIGEGFNVLSLGALNVFIALGLALTFRLMNVINLAHGEFLMAGAYTVFMVTSLGLPFWSAVIIAAIMGFLLGMMLEFLLVRRFYRSGELSILGTWGLSIVLQQIAEFTFGKQHQNIANPIPGATEILGVQVPTYRIAIFLVAVVLTAVVLSLLQFTRLGTQIRAVSADNDLSETLGVPAKVLKLIVFAASTSIAAAAGGLVAPIVSVGPSMGVDYVFIAFIIVIVAGSRLSMLVAAGFGAALVQNFMTLAFDPVLARIAVLLLAVIVYMATQRSSRLAPA